METILVDVEEPLRQMKTISLEKAVETYLLDEEDVAALKDGLVVWYGDIALSKHPDEEAE